MANELVTVFAFDKGTIRYRGIKWSITLRAVVLENGACVEGDIQQARVFMDAMIAAAEDGLYQFDPSCLVRDPLDQRPADEQRDVPPAGDVKSELTTSICKQIRKGKTVYVLGYKLANGDDPIDDMQIMTPQAVKLLETSLTQAGFDVAKIPANPTSFKMKVSWKKGAEFKPGKFYHDYTEFVILTQKAAK